MFVKSLHLRNFRSYDHLDLTFTDARTLIVGENGVGKSTIVDAIALVLTGQCRGVNGKGEGQRDLIKGNADEATITLDTDVLGPVTLTIHRTQGTSRTMPVDMILGALRTSAAFVTAAVYGSTFFDLGHADAKGLLMRLLDVRVPFEENGQPITLTLADSERRYRAAFDQRTALNRTLKGIVIPPEPPIPASTVTEEQIRDARATYEAAVTLTADVRAQARMLTETKQRLEGVAPFSEERARGTIDATQVQLDEAIGGLTIAQQELAAARALPAEATDTLSAEINELRVFVQRIEATAPAKAPAATGKRKAKAAGAVNENLPGHAPAVCVLGCGIPCLTPPAEFQAALKSTQARIDALAARVAAGTERAAMIQRLEYQVSTGEQRITRHRAQIADVQERSDRARTQQAELADVLARLAIVEPQAVASQADVDAKAVALESLRRQQSQMDAYQRAVAERERAITSRASVEDDVKDAEAIISTLGPKGAPMKALEDALGDFHQAINASLQPFGFDLAINVDPWRVLVCHGATARALPFDLLSKGQRLWVGLAFQLALAAVSGLEFCIVDDAEGVVGDARAQLTDVALDAPVGQVLIVKAQAEDDAVPQIDGLQVVQVGRPVGVAF